jgi:hypothetical protein
MRGINLQVETTALSAWHDFEALEGGLLQRLSVIRMSDIDESVCPLAERLPEEIGDPVLCHDVVDVRSCRDHSGTLKTFSIDFRTNRIEPTCFDHWCYFAFPFIRRGR